LLEAVCPGPKTLASLQNSVSPLKYRGETVFGYRTAYHIYAGRNSGEWSPRLLPVSTWRESSRPPRGRLELVGTPLPVDRSPRFERRPQRNAPGGISVPLGWPLALVGILPGGIGRPGSRPATPQGNAVGGSRFPRVGPWPCRWGGGWFPSGRPWPSWECTSPGGPIAQVRDLARQGKTSASGAGTGNGTSVTETVPRGNAVGGSWFPRVGPWPCRWGSRFPWPSWEFTRGESVAQVRDSAPRGKTSASWAGTGNGTSVTETGRRGNGVGGSRFPWPCRWGAGGSLGSPLALVEMHLPRRTDRPGSRPGPPGEDFRQLGGDW